MAGHRQLNVSMHTLSSDRLAWPKLDVEELFVTLRPTIRAVRLEAIQRELSSRLPGLPRKERAARLTEIDQQLLALEMSEEAMIEEAEAAGIRIARRVDADPRAILGSLRSAPHRQMRGLINQAETIMPTITALPRSHTTLA